jgi:hypothetical protein
MANNNAISGWLGGQEIVLNRFYMPLLIQAFSPYRLELLIIITKYCI